jgi:hypothetical protein
MAVLNPVVTSVPAGTTITGLAWLAYGNDGKTLAAVYAPFFTGTGLQSYGFVPRGPAPGFSTLGTIQAAGLVVDNTQSSNTVTVVIGSNIIVNVVPFSKQTIRLAAGIALVSVTISQSGSAPSGGVTLTFFYGQYPGSDSQIDIYSSSATALNNQTPSNGSFTLSNGGSYGFGTTNMFSVLAGQVFYIESVLFSTEGIGLAAAGAGAAFVQITGPGGDMIFQNILTSPSIGGAGFSVLNVNVAYNPRMQTLPIGVAGNVKIAVTNFTNASSATVLITMTGQPVSFFVP